MPGSRSLAQTSALVLLTGLALVPLAFSAGPGEQSGTILSIERHAEVTPLEYVFNVVAAYYETVTYRVRVRADNEVYDADYAPDVQPDGLLPSDWKEGATVQFRIEKRKVIFLLPSGREIEARLTARRKA